MKNDLSFSRRENKRNIFNFDFNTFRCFISFVLTFFGFAVTFLAPHFVCQCHLVISLSLRQVKTPQESEGAVLSRGEPTLLMTMRRRCASALLHLC